MSNVSQIIKEKKSRNHQRPPIKSKTDIQKKEEYFNIFTKKT